MTSGTLLAFGLSDFAPAIQIGLGATAGFFAARWYYRDLLKQLESALFAVQLANREMQGVASLLGGRLSQHTERIQEIQSNLSKGEELTEATLKSAATQLVKETDELQTDLSGAKEKLRLQNADLAATTKVARTDPVTFLLNRKSFEEQIDELLTQKKPGAEPGVVFIVSINATSDAGERLPISDHVLRESSGAISRSLNGADAIVSRYDNDSFGIALSSCSSANCEHQARQIHKAIQQCQINEGGKSIRIQGSIGLTRFTTDAKTGALLTRSKMANSAAIAAGGNCSYLHDGNQCVRLDPVAAVQADANRTPPEKAISSEAPATVPPSAAAAPAQLASWVEKRAHKRQSCDAQYLIAPYDNGELPTADMFFPVRFTDISPAGCGILLPAPPKGNAFVIALNKPDGVIHLSASVVNVRKQTKHARDDKQKELYVVGCKFTSRVQIPTGRRQLASPQTHVAKGAGAVAVQHA